MKSFYDKLHRVVLNLSIVLLAFAVSGNAFAATSTVVDDTPTTRGIAIVGSDDKVVPTGGILRRTELRIMATLRLSDAGQPAFWRRNEDCIREVYG